jgi:hypothetical protein
MKHLDTTVRITGTAALTAIAPEGAGGAVGGVIGHEINKDKK